MPSVLIIDDDTKLLALVREYLGREGFTVETSSNGEDGTRAALHGAHDIVVLDVMMPGIGGIEVLRRIRAVSTLPVLMLTARGDDSDRILGLELGADDYVPKPCTLRELTARLRAILRRVSPQGQGVPESHPPLVVGDLRIYPEQRRAEWQGRPVALTSTEFNLLEVLARHAGQPVSKRDLSEQALGRPLERYDRAIDVHLSSIRHKLGTLADGRSCIQTVYRLGYQLIWG